MAVHIAKRMYYYLGVFVLQTSTLLFILVVSGIYKPFYTAPEAHAVIIPPKIPETIKVTSGIPARLEIPSLGIDRNLLDGIYDPNNASWTLTPRGVHYAVASAPANDFGGSTFIYGHNNAHVFGPLDKLEDGSTAEITTHNGLIFQYRFTQRDTLNPTDTSPLTYQASPRLTLQTCSGNWHQNRELFYFELIDVSRVDEPEDANSNSEIQQQITPLTTLSQLHTRMQSTYATQGVPF